MEAVSHAETMSRNVPWYPPPPSLLYERPHGRLHVPNRCKYCAHVLCQVNGPIPRPFEATEADLCNSLLPALAYTLDMDRRTAGFYGVNESLFSSALAAMVFSTVSAQPLTIVGITGLISLFNYTIYDIIKIYDVTLYARFMCWTAIWAAIWHWLVAISQRSEVVHRMYIKQEHVVWS